MVFFLQCLWIFVWPAGGLCYRRPMFRRSVDPDKIVMMASILLLGGLLPLAVAYCAQILLHLQPCHFCMLQRYPYVLVALMGAVLLTRPRMGLGWRFCVALGLLGLLATGILGIIHTGIESGWLHYTGGCVTQAPADNSLAALRAAIASAPLVACDQPAAQFFGLSMASWNALWALFVIVLTGLQYRFEWRRLHGT